MLKHYFFSSCCAAILFCAVQSQAQPSSPTTFPHLTLIPATHTGLQTYQPARRWHGLDLARFFGTQNTATGVGALASCTSCFYNVADGYNALYSITTGYENVAVGYTALYSCTSCEANVAIGSGALYDDVTGSENTAIGWASLDIATGGANTAIGYATLEFSTTGTYNTALGNYAGQDVTTGVNNTALGTYAFNQGQGESYMTAVGAYAGESSASNGYNTAIGAYALYGNWGSGINTGSYNLVTGAKAMYNNSTGGNNSAMGFEAMYSNTAGGANTSAGAYSMYENTTGSDNVAYGYGANFSNTTGGANTAIGLDALIGNTTGSDNTALGCSANVNSGTLTNATALGYSATATASNQVMIGSTSVTSIGGYANWSNFSDGRYKKNIQPNVPGLAFINQLTPVTYTLDIDGIEKKLNQNKPSLPAEAGSRSDPQDDPVRKQAAQDKAAVIYTGFVAQDVEKTASSLGFVFSGIDKPKNTDQSFYGLRYGDFVPPLVKAVQELSASSDKKDSAINALQTKFDSLQVQFNELRALVLAQKPAAASLDQNTPNPFTGSTVIGYSLPAGVSSAQMRISDMNGKVLAVIPLSGTGRSSVKADVSGYAAGTYIYSLIVDGKLAGTRQMISVR